jgi:hypothetical protein
MIPPLKMALHKGMPFPETLQTLNGKGKK